MVKYKIKERRLKLGMKQKTLIEKSGLSKAQLSKLENGYTVNISVDTLFRLAQALKCSITSLVVYESTMPDKSTETEV